MKKMFAIALLCLSTLALAQQPATPAPVLPDNLYAAGVSYNNGATPAVAGTALYAHKMNDAGTYAFTVVDALPTSVKPFRVETSFGAGVAQKVFTIGKVPIFVPTSAGISYTGTNTGWAWTTGALASISLKNNWRVLPNVRIVKSSVGGAGYQSVVGVMFGWAN